MLQRLHAVFQNSFFTAIVLLVVLILTLSIAVTAVLYLPISIGEQPQTLYIDEMYYFPSLSLSTFDYVDIEYAEGGFLVPAYSHTGTIKGVSIIGNGDYSFYPENSAFREQGKLKELYIPMQEEQLALLLLTADFTEINSRNQILSSSKQVIEYEESYQFFDQIRYQSQALLEKESGIYISIRLFGYERVYMPDTDAVIGLFVTSNNKEMIYYENKTISLYNYQTHEEYLHSKHPNMTVDYPPSNLLIYASITLSLLLIASILVVWLLTIDLDVKKQVQQLREQVEYPHWLIAVTVILYFVSQLLLMPYGVGDHWTYVLTLSLYLLIFMVFCKNHAERQYIGLNFYHWGHAITSALVLGFFFQMLGSFNVPSRFAIDSYLDLLTMFVVAFIFQGLISELIFRGIIQNYIERITNTLIAIIATAGIVAAINYVANTYVHEMATIEIYIQSFLIAPFGSVVLSLLYVRTRSILASSLLATLLIILPRILVF